MLLPCIQYDEKPPTGGFLLSVTFNLSTSCKLSHDFPYSLYP